MAVATALTLAGLGMSAFQTVKGITDANKAKRDLANLETPDLNNAFENIQISTVGSDLMKEQNAMTSANMIDSARSGGVRSVMGSIPRIMGINNDQNKEARAYLDNQVQQRSYAIAEDDMRLRQMNEQRYQSDVAGLGNQMAVGQQNMWSGLRGGFQSLAYGMDNGAFAKAPNETVNAITTQQKGSSLLGGGFKANSSNTQLASNSPLQFASGGENTIYPSNYPLTFGY
jgi:hypothetical protein